MYLQTTTMQNGTLTIKREDFPSNKDEVFASLMSLGSEERVNNTLLFKNTAFHHSHRILEDTSDFTFYGKNTQTSLDTNVSMH